MGLADGQWDPAMLPVIRQQAGKAMAAAAVVLTLEWDLATANTLVPVPVLADIPTRPDPSVAGIAVSRASPRSWSSTQTPCCL